METYVSTDIPVVLALMSTARVPAQPATASQTFPVAVDVLPVDATNAAVTITLPLLSRSWANGVGRMLSVKKVDASANVVTIKGNGAELIEGFNTLLRSAQWTSAWLLATPSGWIILSVT